MGENMMEGITFIFDGAPSDGEIYKTTKSLKGTSSIRAASLEVINEAINQNKGGYWVKDIDRPDNISVYVSSDQVTDASSGYNISGFGIKYGLDSDGSVRILEDYTPLKNDWTLSEIKEMISSGYIRGDYRTIIVAAPVGLGADFNDIFDWVGFLADTIEIIGVSYSITRYISVFVQNWRIRNIIRKWKSNGIQCPRQVREFIDTKGDWALKEVKKRLALDEEQAIKLLDSLGLEPKGNVWRLTHSKGSIANRKRWLRNEKRYAHMSDKRGKK